MVLRILAICALYAFSNARPNNVAPQNVITVPPNCPAGQVWANGQCRDKWNRLSMADPEILAAELFDQRNVVTVPPNCPPGQQWFNGACREVWFIRMQQVLQESRFGELLLKPQEASVDSIKTLVNQKNIISIPNQCPQGYKADALGICRPVF